MVNIDSAIFRIYKAIKIVLMIIEITNKVSTCLLKFRSVEINFVQYFQSASCRGDAVPCLRKSVKKLTIVFLLSINAYITVNKVKKIPANPKKTLYDYSIPFLHNVHYVINSFHYSKNV